MDNWSFVQAAYGLVIISTFLLVVRAFGRLRAAEKKLKK